MTNVRQKYNPEFLHNKTDMLVKANFNKAKIRNLREQSPFQKGQRNKDFVNPSLASNVVFYNYGREQVRNPHFPQQQKQKGYNLDNYVIYDVEPGQSYKEHSQTQSYQKSRKSLQKSKSQRLITSSQRSQNKISRRSISRVRKSQRSITPRRSSRTVLTKNKSVSQSQHINKSVNSYKQRRLNAKKLLLRTDEREEIKESTNSGLINMNNAIHTQRQQYKEQNQSQQQQQSGKDSQSYQNPSKYSRNQNGSEMIKKEVQYYEESEHMRISKKSSKYSISQKSIRKSQRSKSPIRRSSNNSRLSQNTNRQSQNTNRLSQNTNRQSQNTNGQSYSEYGRVSGTNVSNPDNLVCDNCVNRNMYQNKLDDIKDQREQEKEYAQRLDKNLKQQLQEERERARQKMRIYQEAIDSQRHAMEDKKRKQAEQEAMDNKLVLNGMFNDNYEKDLERENQKKKKFLEDLKNQIRNKKEKDYKNWEDDFKRDQQLDNLLIDDNIKRRHQDALKEHYRKQIIEQMKDQDEKNRMKKERNFEEDLKYQRKLKDLIENENSNKRNMEQQKKFIFMKEIEQQLNDKHKKLDREREQEMQNTQNYWKKLDRDQQLHMNNIFQKKQRMEEYLNDLNNQVHDLDDKRRQELLDKLVYKNTTLKMAKKPHKCYNCAMCLNQYPLKYLNKKRKVKKY